MISHVRITVIAFAACICGYLSGRPLAELIANRLYDGAMERMYDRRAGSEAKCAVLVARCSIPKGTKVERRMFDWKVYSSAECPAKLASSLWDVVGKRTSYSIQKGDLISYMDFSSPYSDN